MPIGIKAPRGGLRGAIDALLVRNIEWLLSIRGRSHYRAFEAATRRTEECQAEVLREIVSRCAKTAYGREHGFAAIETYEDYRSRVPVNDYEALRPYVDRHASGESDVLFPGKPLMYTHTSGTTDKQKLLPITQYAFERTVKHRSKLWLYILTQRFPGIFSGKDLSMVSRAVEGHTEDGTPYGSMSGVMYRHIPSFIKLVHTIPYEVVGIGDYDSKIYTLMRFAMASDVSCIFTGNPATVVNLVTRGDAHKQDIIRDIRDGTLKKDVVVEPELRREIEALLQPDPRHAAFLERLADQHDRLRPRDYWPNLKLINTWTQGNCRLVLPKLHDWFSPETPVLDFGYVASEVIATDVVLPNQGSVLQIQNAFYEFTPFETEDGERSSEFLLAHELEVGMRYFIYVTTFSGLYRYDMNDVLEMTERFNGAPVFKFIFKGRGVTSLQGEKLSEEQFIEGVRRGCVDVDVGKEFFVGYADPESSRYELFIELADRSLVDRLPALGEAVDRHLRELNIEYEAKRKSDRLGQLVAIDLGPDAFSRFRTLRLSEGAHDGQIKWLHLSGTRSTKRRMRHLVEER